VQDAVAELRSVVARAEDRLVQLGDLETAVRTGAPAPQSDASGARRTVVRRWALRDDTVRVVRRQDGRGAVRDLLAEIEGIDQATEDRLVTTFSSILALRAASTDEIAGVEGVGQALAARIAAAADG
jgi:hypothetical protein